MPAIHLDHVSFRHSSAVTVLDGATAHLGPGWTGVVGANGAGKTTLLRLVSGELDPAMGRILRDPSDGVVVTVEQSVERLDAPVVRFAESWEAADAAMRARLQLDPADLDRWPSLSPGERKRWQIGAALAARPDVLLLDEPTNHLDAAGREVLVGALRSFEGVGLVVSHDRTLLETLTVRTLRIHTGEVSMWSGGYGTARQAWTAEREAEVAGYQSLRREQRKIDRRIADQRRAAETKRAWFRRQQRTSIHKDIDARSAMAQRRFREGEASAAQVLAGNVRQQERVGERLEATIITKELGGRLFVDYEASPKRILATVTGPLQVADHVLVDAVDLTVERDDRAWLRGANGAGKTTLLRRMLDLASVPEDRLLWLPQELTAEEETSLLDEVRALDPEVRGKVMAVVAALGVDPDALLVSDRPSPGEARKLTMGLGLGRAVWLAVLDEPTNHLDLPSIERLETALVDYPGALVVVTHDDAFGEALGLAEWCIEGGELMR